MIVFLDTNIVIYAVELSPGFGPQATAKLTSLRNAGASSMISDLVRMECLVGPLKTRDAVLENQFRSQNTGGARRPEGLFDRPLP